MPDTTPRLAMPFLIPGQAQKELFHNEALIILDAAVQPAVLGTGTDAPPPTPQSGDCHLVGDAPTGAWAGRAGALAAWTGQGWRFVTPFEGMAVWDVSRRLTVRRVGGTWIAGTVDAARVTVAGIQVIGAQRPGIAAPAGGPVVDAEARGALAAILETLRGHGLIAA